MEDEGPRGRSDSAESAEGSSTNTSEDEGAGGCGRRAALGAGPAARGALFEQLMHECRTNAAGERLSARLRDDLERLSPGQRAALVAGTRGGAAPLFVACARGNTQAAEYLVQVCGADLEQRGVYRAPADSTPHRVTPLWAAAVAGHMEVLACLARAGAQIDAGSDSGSTPLRSACFMSHVEVARFLLARGADVRRANHHGGTCLVNAVQSPPLCEVLLRAGAEVDARDSQLKTALHYAVQEHRSDTVRLLLAHGADPLLTTRQGDDALTIACVKGATSIVHVLLGAARYEAARVADALELLGATLLDEHNDVDGALAAWRRATALRHDHVHRAYTSKRPVRAPVAALGRAREWRTQDELDAHEHDVDYLRTQVPTARPTAHYRGPRARVAHAGRTGRPRAEHYVDYLRTQALLVATRVLGPDHNDTLFRLMYRGASYADGFRYGRCAALWGRVLQLRIAKDTLLHPETCQTLLALTRLLLESGGGRGWGGAGPLEPRRAALDVLRQVARAVPECQRLVRVRPACRVQGAVLGRALRCATHLAHVALGPAPLAPPASMGAEDKDDDVTVALKQEMRGLVGMEPTVPATGDTLLHLACSRLNVVRSTYFTDEPAAPPSGVFPSAGVARLLLESGAAVARRNLARSTPLHVAAIPHNFSTELVETLLRWGAHLDQPNRFGDSPHELVALSPDSRLCPLRHLSLACLAARALVRRPSPSHAHLPATLRAFLDLHRP